MKKGIGGILHFLDHADYAWSLPLMARLPVNVGYWLSAMRGACNAYVGRDWRSMALGKRHIAAQSAAGFRLLCPEAAEEEVLRCVRERFRVESREEFEGCLVAADRLQELSWEFVPRNFADTCLQRKRGLVLLASHFDSFWLGTVFLGLAGVRINAMTSAVTHHPLVAPAVSHGFQQKYRGMEKYMNGGRMLNMEDGLRPFYQMLERGECLVILADAPAVAGGAVVTPSFLGARRTMAGGAFRIAQKTESDIGTFVCRYLKPGCYQVEGGPITAVSDPEALDKAYSFLSKAIMAAPERWCAADLFPAMVAVAPPLKNTEIV